MSIKECYDKMGADFDEVMQRLGSESFIKRFAVKFLDDSSYQMILDGIEAKDAELAFRGAHTLKGVAGNLSMTKLYNDLVIFVDYLRNGADIPSAVKNFPELKTLYNDTVNAIK